MYPQLPRPTGLARFRAAVAMVSAILLLELGGCQTDGLSDITGSLGDKTDKATPARSLESYREAADAQKARAGGETGHRAPVEALLTDLPAGAALITVIDGHPATLSWLGGVRRHVVHALGVQGFGQSGDLIDLFRVYGLDADAIAAAASEAMSRRLSDRSF